MEDGQEDVDGVEVDGEGEGDGGAAVSAGADAGEVADGEEGEDAEGEPGVGVGREEVEEHADDADDDEAEERGEGDAGDLAVVDVEEVGDAAHDAHSGGGGGGGLEDELGAEGVDVAVDEGADLPAHEVGEGEEEAKGEAGVGFAGEIDAEDEGDDGDEAGQGRPLGRGVDADGGDEEAEGGDAEDFGEERGGAFAGDVDDGGAGVGLVHAVVIHIFAPGLRAAGCLAAGYPHPRFIIGLVADGLVRAGQRGRTNAGLGRSILCITCSARVF